MSYINQICRQLINKSFPKDLELIILAFLLPVKHPKKELLHDISMLRKQEIMVRSPLSPGIYLQAVDITFIVIPRKITI